MTHRTSLQGFSQHRQHGAALVVGLILLVALTLLALSSMNTASLDLIMAGNEQYRARSFTAAEAGIEIADLSDANFTTEAAGTNGAGTTGTGESYNWTVQHTATYNAKDGNSANTYQSLYFTVTSTATGTRGATATHVQEERWNVKTGDDGGLPPADGPGLSDDLLTFSSTP